MTQRHRFFGTEVNHHAPLWAPLAAATGSPLSWRFMWMGEVLLEDGRSVHLYKHKDTRRYLNISTDGHFFSYGADGSWREVALSDAALEVFDQWDRLGATAEELSLVKKLGRPTPRTDRFAPFSKTETRSSVLVNEGLIRRVADSAPTHLASPHEALVDHALRLYALDRELHCEERPADPLTRVDYEALLMDEEFRTGRDFDTSAEESQVSLEG